MNKTILRAAVACFVAGALSTTAFAQAKKPKRAPARKPAAAPAKPAPAPAPAAEPAPAEADPSMDAAPAAAPAPASASEGGAYRPAYGMAGCGLGSLVIKNQSKGPQIGAWFLNVIGYQTSAITSGTSNCKTKGGAAHVDEQETFVSVNLPRLEQEAAQGQGELLASYAELLGCRGESASALMRLSQERFDFVFEKKDAGSVLSRTHELLKDSAVECARV
jgi:hypothetical protein